MGINILGRHSLSMPTDTFVSQHKPDTRDLKVAAKNQSGKLVLKAVYIRQGIVQCMAGGKTKA